MSLTVLNKNDEFLLEIKEYSFSSEHMGEKKITSTIYTTESVDVVVGCYVVFRGANYTIENNPSITKAAKTGIGIGSALKYDLVFFSPIKKLDFVNFEDYVSKDDSDQYYTGTPTFDFFNTVKELAIRIQANMDRFFGDSVWNVVVDESVTLEELQVSVSNNTLREGLDMVNSIYGLDYYVNGNDITIGGEGLEFSEILTYGKGNGLYQIQRVFESGSDIITRLKAYGSGRNLPYDYLRDENAKGRYFTQLMLPNFATTGIDYVDAPQEIIDEYGIREGSYIFEDVYPSIEEIDLGSGRIDEIIRVDSIDLDSDYFTVGVRDLGFDINDYPSSKTPLLSIKGSNADGNPTYLGGYEFEIISVSQVATGYDLVLLKNQADNAILPDLVTTVRVGDRYVLLEIEMPPSYIINAEDKLAIKADEYMSDEAGQHLSYPIKIDEKFIIENDLGDDLDAGIRIKIEDLDLNIANFLTAQSVSIKFGSSPIPTYEAKLSSIKSKTLKSELNFTKIQQSNFNAISNNRVNFNTANNNTTVNKINRDITWQ